MKTVNLHNEIKNLAEKHGIREYRIEGMKLSDGNYQVTPEGELARDLFIDVKIIPIRQILEIPITFTIKRDNDE